MKSAAASIVFTLMLAGVMAHAAADKARLTLKANPTMAFSPARIVVTAEMTGGPNDNQQLYCAAIEWEWGDGTKSEESADCDPYQAGKSEIKRHFTADHTYRVESEIGAISDYREYRIQLRLRKNGKVVLSGGTSVKIKPEMEATAAPSRRP